MSARTALALALGLAAWALPAAAELQEPPAPPGAVETRRSLDPPAPYGIALGPASSMAPPLEEVLEGPRLRIAWQSPGASGAMLEAVADGLRAAGFADAYRCHAVACGGFGFRLSRPALPMPDMFVDLGGYRYLALRRADPPALASLLASDAPEGGFLQLSLIAPTPAAPAPPPPEEPPAFVTAAEPASRGFAERLAAEGRLVLDGVRFATGSATLTQPAPPVLAELATWLAADPGRRVALVGHTDWTGAAEANVALSRARADSVAAWLTDELGASAAQIDTAGLGPYAPRADNTAAEGRDANRRVEVVLLPPGGG